MGGLVAMEPVTNQTLAANAYRTLGISALSTQADIEAAARKMRIWPDASRIPPTPWDLPWLGPMGRSRAQIEQAVSLLHQPIARLEQRLLWFGVSDPPADSSAAAWPVSAAAWTDWPAREHARVLGQLQRAWVEPPNRAAEADWPGLLAATASLCRSPAAAQWLRQAENAGGFDKPASDAEIAAALAALPAAIAAGLIKPAVAAAEGGDAAAIASLITAIRAVPAAAPLAPADMLFDRIEDQFDIRTAEMEKQLRDNLRIDRLNPDRLANDNYDHTTVAADIYKDRVSPVLAVLMTESADDADRMMRVRSRAGEVLVLLALGWEWSVRHVAAEDQLNQALQIAAGTVTELDIRRALDRVTPLARLERAVQERGRIEQRLALSAPMEYMGPSPILPAPLPRPKPPKVRKIASKVKGKSQYAYIFVAVVFGLRLLVNVLNSDRSSDNQPTLPTEDPFVRQLRQLSEKSNSDPAMQKALEQLGGAFPNPMNVNNPKPIGPNDHSVGESLREPPTTQP